MRSGAFPATTTRSAKGRVGCNFVTSTAERAAQNFGLDAHLEHDLRYEMAEEFVDLVEKLWSSDEQELSNENLLWAIKNHAETSN